MCMVLNVLLIQASEFFVYAAALAIAMLIFWRMAQGYNTRDIEGDASSTESRPLLRHRSRVSAVEELNSLPTQTIKLYRKLS